MMKQISHYLLVLPLSFSRLEEIAQKNPPEILENGQEVSIRGFVYQTAEGEWIVTAESNLSSCCIGSKHKASKQIRLKGQFPEDIQGQIVTFTGRLHVLNEDPLAFSLDNPQRNMEGAKFPIISVIIITALCLLGLARACRQLI